MLNWRELMNCEEDQNGSVERSKEQGLNWGHIGNKKEISRITIIGQYVIPNLLYPNYEVTEKKQ